MSNWISNDIKPELSGYYMTLYYNEEQKHDMFKAFWYDTQTSKWIFRFDPDVKAWWNVRHEYYVPCQYDMKIETPVPKEFLA